MSTFASIRNRLGMTQAEIAECIGVTQGNVSHYESRGQVVPPDIARRLICVSREHGHPITFNDVYEMPPETSRRRAKPSKTKKLG